MYKAAKKATRRASGSGPSYFGTAGVITGLTLNGAPIRYPGWEYVMEYTVNGDGPSRLLSHVVGEHRAIEEMHVYEDIMLLVDWVWEDRQSIVTAEHARHVIEIIEAAYRAAETGQTQELTTTF